MHDPHSLAFRIKHPFFPYRASWGNWGLVWPDFIDIWHVDPETDGTDDSCGWSHQKLTKEQKSQLQWLAGCEARTPWIQKLKKKEPTSPADAEALMRGALYAVARQLRIKVSIEEITELAISLVHSPADNVRSRLCHLPGYHSNFKEDTEEQRTRSAGELFHICANVLLRDRRPWWRHPRWHFWHWEVRIWPLQHFKRWMWSRCSKCGKRFKWGEAPISNQWHSSGPQWFKGETNLEHGDCTTGSCSPAAEAT